MPTLLLSHGNSSRCATLAILGVLAALSVTSRRAVPVTRPFLRPVTVLSIVLGAAGSVAVARAAYVQVARGDETAAAGTLTLQADLQRRFQYNPRLYEIARGIPRGSILDRNGLPLATSDWPLLERNRGAYQSLGVSLDRACAREDPRHYPFGGRLFHVLGDLRTRTNWGAANTSFLERDAMQRLQGYDTHPRAVPVEDPVSGRTVRTLAYDYSALVPLLRRRSLPQSAVVRSVMERPRDLRATIDARLQTRLAAGLERRLAEAGRDKGAIVGDRLRHGRPAGVRELPVARPRARRRGPRGGGRARPGARRGCGRRVSRPRPLRPLPAGLDLQARRRDGGALGGQGRCDVQLRASPRRRGGRARAPVGNAPGRRARHAAPRNPGARAGPDRLVQRLLRAARDPRGRARALREGLVLGISVARPNTPEALAKTLAPAGFGQGHVVASPLQMARVAAAVAEDGAAPEGRWILGDGNDRTDSPRRVLSADDARRLARAMRSVVTSGTGTRLRDASVPVAGKTGTAEVEGAPAHAWFVGFAPYGSGGRTIAFAVIVENGRYGGGVAAEIASDVVAELRRLGADAGERP
jgi:hypothetical protein